MLIIKLSADEYDRFVGELAKPVRDMPKMRELMKRESPWSIEKDED